MIEIGQVLLTDFFVNGQGERQMMTLEPNNAMSETNEAQQVYNTEKSAFNKQDGFSLN